MFNPIKSFFNRILKRRSNVQQKRIDVVDVKLLDNELLLESLVSLFVDYLTSNKFSKQYHCIIKFVNQSATTNPSEHPLTFNDLIKLDEESYPMMQEVGLLKLAKRYCSLGCKCPGNPEFDSWMKKLSTIIVS